MVILFNDVQFSNIDLPIMIIVSGKSTDANEEHP